MNVSHALCTAGLVALFAFSACSEESLSPPESAADRGGISAKRVEISFTPLVWTGSVHIARPGFRIYRFPDNGPEIDIDNPTSRDGNSFFEVQTGLDSSTGCGEECQACHFKFVMELDIEADPDGPYADDDQGFFDAWHGDNVNDMIGWSHSGGSNSGWYNGNDPNTFGHTSIARYQVDETVPCGEETSITITASSSTGLVTPVSVTITLKCDECEE